MNIEDLIDELCTDPRYAHAVFGCFGEIGHYVKEEKGFMHIWSFEPLFDLFKYAHLEDEYCMLFDKETNGPEFKARVHGEKIPEGYKLKLIFNDRQGDTRGSSHTDYTLIIPKSEVQRIVPVIKNNPSILIEVFQNMFPDYDRSKGSLVMHPVEPESIDYKV